jgi:outer membrane lipoprotein-sorting protein
MRQSISKYIFAALFASVFVIGSAPAASAQGVLSEILRRMDIHNKALQSVQSDLTMVKSNTQLGVSDTFSGSTSYLKAGSKMYVRVDWTKPNEERISIIGDDYELYQVRLNQVIYGKVNRTKSSSSVGGALAFMSMSRDELNANYKVTYLGEETVAGGTRTWRLQLDPIKPVGYKRAELWVDQDGMPRQAKVTEQNNDTTTVLLSAIRKNQKIKADIFKLNAPKTAKRVKG